MSDVEIKNFNFQGVGENLLRSAATQSLCESLVGESISKSGIPSGQYLSHKTDIINGRVDVIVRVKVGQ